VLETVVIENRWYGTGTPCDDCKSYEPGHGFITERRRVSIGGDYWGETFAERSFHVHADSTDCQKVLAAAKEKVRDADDTRREHLKSALLKLNAQERSALGFVNRFYTDIADVHSNCACEVCVRQTERYRDWHEGGIGYGKS
jgi:hypothetical protein